MNIFQHKNIIKPPLLPGFISSVIQFDKFFHSAISHSPNQKFFEDTFVSHPGGPNEQFGTHEKLSCGGAR